MKETAVGERSASPKRSARQSDLNPRPRRTLIAPDRRKESLDVLEKVAPICCIVGGSIIAATAQLTVPLAAVAVGPLLAIGGGTVVGMILLLVPRRGGRHDGQT